MLGFNDMQTVETITWYRAISE